MPDIPTLYALTTTTYLLLQSLPLLLTPSLLLTLAAPEPRAITSLETYLCRSHGLALATFALLVLLHSGLIPLTTRESEGEAPGPYAKGMLMVTTPYHLATALYLYAQQPGNFAFGVGGVVSGGLFCLGLWTLMFAGEGTRVSRRAPGADKRTSGWPFGNVESAREKRKEEKRKAR